MNVVDVVVSTPFASCSELLSPELSRAIACTGRRWFATAGMLWCREFSSAMLAMTVTPCLYA